MEELVGKIEGTIPKKEEEILQDKKEKLSKRLFSLVKDNYGKFFLLILVSALVIRIIVFLKTFNQPVWWDAADYLSAAIRWAGINPNLIDMWYYRRGLFWPLFEMIFFKVGVGEVGIRVFVVLFSTGLVAVSYFLIKEMYDKKLAIFVSIGMAFSWVILFFTGRPMTEIPSAFFLLTALLFFWKGYVNNKAKYNYYLFGLFFALACLTRMQYVMFVVPLLAFVFTRERFGFLKNKYLWLSILVFFIMFIPQFYMQNKYFGNPIIDLSTYYLGIGNSQTGEVSSHVGSFSISNLFLYFTNLPYLLDGNEKGYGTLLAFSPLYILFILGFFYFFADLFLGIDHLFKNIEIQKKFFILFWIISIFMLLGFIAPHLEQRYAIQTLPFLFLIIASPYRWVEDFFNNKFKFNKGKIFIIVVIILILASIPSVRF